MQLTHGVLTFAALVSALPPEKQSLILPREIGIDGALRTAAQCHTGQHYCFSEIIDDLIEVSKQDVLHQYCDQKYKNDWQSCNTCKRPWPMPNCWDGPGAWASVFKCTGPETYEWVGRCEGEGSICAAGTCRWTKVDQSGKLALVGNFTPSALR
ncbi:hypothetical protein SVAN01_02538 [Stagonosporopsis vannaccii]|nr:hypothetical protein SVAN01_02538 [Stagonosporopsis vannaccii]